MYAGSWGSAPQTPGRLRSKNVPIGSARESRWGCAPDPVGAPPQIPLRRGSGGGSPQRGSGGSAPIYILAAKPPRGLGLSPNRRGSPDPTSGCATVDGRNQTASALHCALFNFLRVKSAHPCRCTLIRKKRGIGLEEELEELKEEKNRLKDENDSFCILLKQRLPEGGPDTYRAAIKVCQDTRNKLDDV